MMVNAISLNNQLDVLKSNFNLENILPAEILIYCQGVSLYNHFNKVDHATNFFTNPLSNLYIIPFNNLSDHDDFFLATARRFIDSDDDMVLISQWSKYFLSTLMPTAIVLISLFYRSIKFSGGLVVFDQGLPVKIWLPKNNVSSASDDFQLRHLPLLEDELNPLFEYWGKKYKLSARVFWSNLGHVWEYALTLLKNLPSNNQIIFHDYERLFESRSIFQRETYNPMRRVIHYVKPSSSLLPKRMRVRKTCCLKNCIENESLCSSCPLLLTMVDQDLKIHLAKVLDDE